MQKRKKFLEKETFDGLDYRANRVSEVLVIIILARKKLSNKKWDKFRLYSELVPRGEPSQS